MAKSKKTRGEKAPVEEKRSAWRHLLLPFKAVKWIYTKAREKQQEAEIKKMKPKSLPLYQDFAVLDTIKGKIDDFNNLLGGESKIGIIIGARGTGKSALGMRILENVRAKTKKKVYAMGFDIRKVPEWIEIVDNIEQIKNNSFILIDESGINFSSRESMSSGNKLLSDLMFIARHKNLSILFITQNSSNIEINTLRQADYLLLKPSSLLQMDFERKVVKEIYEEVEKKFDKFQEPGTTYIYSDKFRGFIKNNLPSFWSDGLSKSFSGFSESKEEKNDK